MRIWLSKNNDVPLREQLATQILLGIVSYDLKPGQRLPSTRELAQRFQIHANTVSAAYRDLAERGWVEFRKGSGIYVREPVSGRALDQPLELDQVVATLFQIARERGYTLAEMQQSVRRFFDAQPPDHFLVVEPDAELRRILMAEIEEATGLRTAGASLDGCAANLAGAAVAVMFAHAEQAREQLPANTPLTVLRLRSVPQSMQGEERPADDALVTVVSRWPEFLKWAHTMLVAAGVDADALDLRDARRRGWQRGLATSTLVISDALTARQLPAGCRARVFRIISDTSLDELRRFKSFVARPAS
ncbi:MAG: GntR family transcriptional regulator [Blastocatellia bacterium]